MLDMFKSILPNKKTKPAAVVEPPKPEPKPGTWLMTKNGKLFIIFVVLNLIFLASFITFLSITTISESEEEAIMSGEMEITKTTQLMAYLINSVKNYFQF